MRRPEPQLHGPLVAARADIDALNRVFSDAFTDRYRQDGLTSVRVPWLNAEIWEYAIADAGDGAMIWRDERGEIAAFNMTHCSGRQGWMGPLAVRPDRQGSGIGRRIVTAGVERLRALGATTIGLETMPRTIDNIGFYARLGFVPGHLTVTMQRQAPFSRGAPPQRLGKLPAAERTGLLRVMRHLADEVAPGADFTREVELTLAMHLGDVSLQHRGDGTLEGFALWHTAPIARGRPRDEVRVLKLVARDEATAMGLIRGVERLAEPLGVLTTSIRCQTAQTGLFSALVAEGYRVHWTDLRLTLDGCGEPAYRGVFLSNWEI